MQILKKSVKLAIEKTALKLFAARGYDNTTMAEIATAAGVSTGNIYRYHANKEELLYAVIPESFVESCLQMLADKVALVRGMSSQQVAGSKELMLGNEMLMKFMLTHRQKILVLMRECSGTRLASFRTVVGQKIMESVHEHLASLSESSPGRRNEPDQLLLTTVYDNLMNATTNILAADITEKHRKEAMARLLDYHLKGMAAIC
ncbi:MAG: Transcriptional regulator, AcrR family [Candidatus Rifleibacterium amylolyticum]|nr:MAG: Transcriptional regulator, AcrR family [Candidatus Rifleibacterium amylolyticum]